MKFVCIPSIQKQLCKFALSQLPKQGGMPCVLCPKQGNKIEGVVLNRVCILRIFCPKQGEGLKPSAAHLYPNIGQVTPPNLKVRI